MEQHFPDRVAHSVAAAVVNTGLQDDGPIAANISHGRRAALEPLITAALIEDRIRQARIQAVAHAFDAVRSHRVLGHGTTSIFEKAYTDEELRTELTTQFDALSPRSTPATSADLVAICVKMNAQHWEDVEERGRKARAMNVAGDGVHNCD